MWILLVDFVIAVYVAAVVIGILWLFGVSSATLALVTVVVIPATMFVLMLVQGGARIHVRPPE